MRLSAATASILAIGLVAAACGGDDATPEPTDEPTPAAAATEPAEEPAEEVTEAPAEDPTEEPAQDAPTEAPIEEAATEDPTEEPAEDETAGEPEFGTKAAIANGDDPATEFALTSGRYRMQWNTTDCEQIDLLIKQVDGDFEYSKPSTASFASASISGMPEGVYTIEQLDDGCTTWSVRLDRMSA